MPEGREPQGGNSGGDTEPDNNRQPEAKPANPALHGGRSLKQRRIGLFWSRRPSKGRHRRGLSIWPGVRLGSPLPNKGSFSGEEPVAAARVSIARAKR